MRWVVTVVVAIVACVATGTAMVVYAHADAQDQVAPVETVTGSTFTIADRATEARTFAIVPGHLLDRLPIEGDSIHLEDERGQLVAYVMSGGEWRCARR